MAKQLLVFVLIASLAIAAGIFGPQPNRAAASGAAAAVSASSQTCALTTTGGVKCWGNNYYGQLGDGTTTNRATPVDVSGLTSGVAAVSTVSVHACALTTGGGVKCWGNNQGDLGDGTAIDRHTPVDVCATGATPPCTAGNGNLLGDVTAVSAGSYQTCALTTAGGLKCWGDNYYGELGDGQACGNPCTTPVDVSGLTSGVAAVSAGEGHTCALTTGGGVKCWGQLLTGEGTTTNRATPVDVSGLTSGVAAISAGLYHTCALTSGSGLKCWGYNDYGQLGDGTTTNRATPVDVCATGATPPCTAGNGNLLSGVAALSAGGHHTCALTTAGGVKCWGYNGNGQLGDGQVCSTLRCTTPVDVSGLTSGVAAVSAGSYHTCALTTAAGVECWGSNESGELGDGQACGNPCTTPVDVVGLMGKTTLAVPNVQQCADPWGSLPYDGYTTGDLPGDSVCMLGCALTSAVDVLRYYGVSTTPEALNNWLKAHGGYSPEHGVNWWTLPAYALSQGVHLAEPRLLGSDLTTLQNELNAGHPVILGVPYKTQILGHFVVATGPTGGTWSINDPGGDHKTTLAGYGGTIAEEVIIEPAGGTNARLIMRAHSPVEFVLTDPQGRRLGFDPRTSTTYSEIPDAYYGLDGGIAAADGSAFLPGLKTAWVNAPIDGNYSLQVIGTGTGSYSVDGEAYDQSGTARAVTGPSGTTSAGQVDTATINYSSQPAGVGGITSLTGVAPSRERTASHRSAGFLFAALALGGVTFAVGAAWYSRRRWARRVSGR